LPIGSLDKNRGGISYGFQNSNYSKTKKLWCPAWQFCL